MGESMGDGAPVERGRRSGSAFGATVRSTWRDPRRGAPLKLLVAAVVLPVATSVLFGSVPFGVSLNGMIAGTLAALMAFGLILVYRANRVINFAQGSLGSVAAVTGLLLMANRNRSYALCAVIVVVGSIG